MKVYIDPVFRTPDTGEGGIRRIVEAQRKYLPQFGVEVVDDLASADLTAGHGGALPLVAGKPFISHSHGLYWSDYKWEYGEPAANRRVIDCLLCADAITVPSRWVRNAYTRGILRDPKVIYHGIALDEWTPGEPGGYVLYNKPRQDAVCNIAQLDDLVRSMPDTSFVSTLGKPAPNVRLIGRMPYSEMKGVIQQASVYLALPRETFGIGTLEALACGVPVAGWNYGGQREIIVPGETGYLAEPGNYAELAECVRKCFAQRTRLSVNARADVERRWQWQDKIAQYAALYREVLDKRSVKPTVSVVVTCHNLARFLPEALNSVRAQKLKDWECLVVDDASTDQTGTLAREWEAADQRFKYLRSDENLKLSRARNFGIAQAKGRYLINLDADDILTPNALALLVDALEKNPHLHIAYGSLEVMSDDGKEHHANAFPHQFNYLEQMAHLNQLYYAALVRREVWEQVGGNRERMWRAEDAEFWCRAVSFGFRAAKVTEESCIYWRFRADGKSATERKTYPDIDGDWTADFPWAIAHTAQEGVDRKKANQLWMPRFETLPFGAPIKDAPIWHREHPLVSIVIPLGPGHMRYVIDALDSCIAQTEHRWEAIVIDDTGDNVTSIPGAPYARILHTDGRKGAGAARNLGLKEARAPLVLFLDADDTLAPNALAAMLDAYGKGAAGYVFSGWRVIRPDKSEMDFPAKDYNRENWLIGKNEGRNIVTVLMATEDALKVGGFDETMFAYEDWDFFCKCAVEGLCGVPVRQQLVTYRHDRGQRSMSVQESGKHVELTHLMRERYDPYLKGAKEMAQCCGGNKKALQEIEAARAAMRAQMNPATIGTRSQAAPVKQAEPVPPGMVRMRFLGDRRGPVTYYVKGRPYTGAATDDYRFVNAKQEDVQPLENMGVWVRVKVPPTPPPAPPAAPPPQGSSAVNLIDVPPPPPAPAPTPVPTPVLETARSAVGTMPVLPPSPAEQPAPPQPKPQPPQVVPVAPKPVTQTVAPEMVRATEYIPKPKRSARKAKAK